METATTQTQYTNCVVKAHKLPTVQLTQVCKVQILTTFCMWNKIRLQAFIRSHFRLFRSPEI